MATLSAVDIVASTVALYRLWHSDVGTGANPSIIFSYLAKAKNHEGRVND